jgi:hypothetical protein
LRYTCLIKHAETLLRTKDCCTHSLLHAQQDALTQYKDRIHMLESNVDSHKISRCTCNTAQIYSDHLYTVSVWYAFNYILVTLSLISILWLQLEDGEYRPLDPDNIRLPPPAPPSERLLAAVEAFYAPPCHDRPRDR